MPETYISLEDAASFESVSYRGMQSRLLRNPKSFKTREEPRENGGKPRVLVAVSSLSSKARRVYRAGRKSNELQGDDILTEKLEATHPPWYVTTDHHWYMENYAQQYAKAQMLADILREFNDYCGDDRTGFSEQFAAEHGMTQRTLYRMSEKYLEASSWALQYERLTGASYDFLKVMALSRKPKESGTFPSIDGEVKALIENIWFDEKFRRNLGTIQMLYDKLSEECAKSDVPFPSYQTVARYIGYLMDKLNGESAEFLAERGLREWKNKFMLKGERDVTQLNVMEIVMGDEHTFDLFVSYTPPNGKRIAIRPTIIAWMDVRSRKFVGYAICHKANAQDIKNTVAKMAREHGLPRNILIDNGKDYTGGEMTGHHRSERLILDTELKGFYRAIGIQKVYRSLPYQAWDKAYIERVFGTVCNKFSKWFASYVGTLTGSKTAGKVKKDINGMLERGELLTMEEFFAKWEEFVSTVYDVRVHRGLKDSGEKHTTPASLFENAERYTKPAPPDSYIAMLLMKSKQAYVRPTGIQHNKCTYMCEDLAAYIRSHVQIRFMPDDDSRIFAFTRDGEMIGEVPLAEKLNPRFYEDEEQVIAHKSKQNRQLGGVRDYLADRRALFEERAENAGKAPRLVGGVDLTIGKKPENNTVSLPQDRQYAQKLRKDKTIKTDFYDKRGQEVLEKLNKIG